MLIVFDVEAIWQLPVPMGTFDWRGTLDTEAGGWRYALMAVGEVFVLMTGTSMMPALSAGNLATPLMVSSECMKEWFIYS